jgi:transposase-like protein
MSNQSRVSVRQAWVERVDRFQQSNQTVAEFCHAEGISQASLYQWRRKLSLANATATQPLPAFVPVKLRASEASTTPTTVMSVELPGGVRVRLEVSQTCQADS